MYVCVIECIIYYVSWEVDQNILGHGKQIKRELMDPLVPNLLTNVATRWKYKLFINKPEKDKNMPEMMPLNGNSI